MISASLRILPAGKERLRLASERGLVGDDPALPVRELSVTRGGQALIVWLGPVECGGFDAELWELEVET